jgi:hypothetical protein
MTGEDNELAHVGSISRYDRIVYVLKRERGVTVTVLREDEKHLPRPSPTGR